MLLKTIKGILKVFLGITKEDWSEMDHKLLRISTAIIMFIIVGFFWYYFLRSIVPWPF
ncbi:hypothetical protein ACFLQN_01295 [Candidatus Aenigmatarchaeota archaeon]